MEWTGRAAWSAACIWALIATRVAAAVPGTPEPVRPIGEIPQLSGRWFDDDLGVRAKTPHYRTWQVTAGLRIEHVVIALDHATLDAGGSDHRVDDLSASLGWTDEWRDALDQAWYVVGVGGRARGSYGGGWVQYNGHHVFDNQYKSTSYEQGDGSVGFAFLNGGFLRWTPTATRARLRAGVEATASGEAITDDVAIGALRARLIGQAGPFVAWGGIAHQSHAGTSRSVAENVVLDHEDGAHLVLGVCAWWLSYDVVFFHRDEWSGALTAEFQW